MKTYKHTMQLLFFLGIALFFLCIVATYLSTSAFFHNSTYSYPLTYLDISEMFWPVLLFVFIGSILLTFRAFLYTTNRVASDFYDSLPENKLNSFFQRILAVLTYQFSAITISLITIGIVFIQNNIFLNWVLILKLVLSCLAGSILIIGATSIAKSLTGTKLTSIVLTFIILLLPRIITSTVPLFIYYISDYLVPYDTLGILVDTKYNIPYAIISSFFESISSYYDLIIITNIKSIIYSFILGLAYLCAASFLFKRRKAELSGKGCLKDIYGHIQSALLILPILMLAFAVQLEPNKYIFTNWKNLLYLAALLFAVYLAFNLIYSRKLKYLLKSIPFYLISILLCVGIFASCESIAKKIIYYIPPVEEIEYVTIIENPGSFYHTYENDTLSYGELLNRDTKFTDSKMINLLHTSLKDENTLFYHEKGKTKILCTYYLKSGNTVSRKISISDENIKQFKSYLIANKEYYKNSIAVPPWELIDNYSLDFYYFKTLSHEQIENIWNCYYKETPQLAKEDNIEAYSIVNGFRDINSDTELTGSIKTFGKYNNYDFYEYRLITSYTVKTSNLTRSLLSESAMKTHENWNNIISDLDNYKEAAIHINLTDIDNSILGKDKDYISLSYSYIQNSENDSTKDQIDAILDIVKDVNYKDIDCTKDYIYINYRATDANGNEIINNIIFLPVNKVQEKQIYNIMTKNGEEK